jgi:hypothetical protein
VLYLPISRLLGREDTLQLTLLPSTPPMGEGHVLDEQALPRLRPDGLEETQKRTVEAGGRRFLVLFYNQQLGERLEAFVQALPRPDCLRHLACSGPHESLQVVLRADPQALVAILPYLHAALLQFGSSL